MIRGIKGSKITSKTFKFDGEKIKNKLEYQGKGKTPEKANLKQTVFIKRYLDIKMFRATNIVMQKISSKML